MSFFPKPKRLRGRIKKRNRNFPVTIPMIVIRRQMTINQVDFKNIIVKIFLNLKKIKKKGIYSIQNIL